MPFLLYKEDEMCSYELDFAWHFITLGMNNTVYLMLNWTQVICEKFKLFCMEAWYCEL